MKGKKWLVCLLAALIMAMLVSCSGAGIVWQDLIPDSLRTLGQKQANSGLLSEYELIQMIADAIRNDDDMTLAYDSIPDRQLDGLTLDQFQQYIRFLRRGVSGELDSFSKMSDAEEETVRQKILERLPDRQQLAANLQGFWLYYQETGRAQQKFGIFVLTGEDQAAMLSAEWVRRILDLQDVATLYFDAIENNDVDALAILLEPLHLSEDILRLRAGHLIDFYKNNISSRTGEFVLTYARIDGIGFEEFGITNPDLSQSVSRVIEMVGLTDQSCRIDDVIPEVLNADDLKIFLGGKYLLQLGQYENGEPYQVQSGDLESIIGAPALHDDTTCVTTGSGSQKLTLTYQSLKLKAEGTCFRHSRWSARITYLELLDQACRLGSGLGPGQSVDDILKHYPFANETNFMISGKSDGGAVKVIFFIDQSIITAIDLTLTNN